ncbi:cytochrome P450 [Coniophora puteana RWD-64-598 SS2]|uniref:Cytochrome P450 n=1 Tax=Coniophora puteana (strain RWD-64-598) TaxID=741705 RepID=R7SG02_CONPW|nr:cytochrome P450 [Coniophora puteana RWD-64-598 SS2]EIW74014.1 cytochrome P450 [Coniophora puteana RWD-64-598 SS2]
MPIIGNLHQMDAERAWLTYTDWKEKYGDVVYCSILGQDAIILNTEKAAEDLLNHRSSNYSDRLDLPAIIGPYGLTIDTIVLNHTDTWRAHRRVFHQTLRSEAATAYRPMQLRRTAELVERITNSPEAWWDHIRRFSASVILSAIYDHDLSDSTEDDSTLQTVLTALELLVRIFSPSTAMLITKMPIVRSIPTWLPGGWVNAKQGQKVVGDMFDVPYNLFRAKLETGEAGKCVASDALAMSRDTYKMDNFDDVVKGVCGTAYAAGEETTGATLIIFILAMVLHPEVQARAQSEIDEVVGTDRLPDLDDKGSLPYVEAIYRETLRWKPVVPTAIQHATTEEDVYNGYYIPKKALVIPNVWAMTQNPDKYPSPASFNPSRFLDAEGNLSGDEPSYVFGFGRRICPGRHLAKDSVWLAMVRILSMFRIEKTTDAAGRMVEPNPEWTTGITSYPKAFPCKVVPRCEEVLK